MAMHVIKSLNRVEEWLERKFFLFSSRSLGEQEKWESVWPQPIVHRDLLRQLLSLPKGKYHRFVSVFVLEAVVAATTGAAMVAIKKFWEPFESKNWEGALVFLVAFLILNAFQMAADLGKNILVNALREGLLCELRGNLLHKLLRFPLRFYYKMDTGSVLNHVNRDVGLVVDMVTIFLFSGIGTVFNLVSVIIVVLWLNWKIGALMFIALLFSIPIVQLARTTVGKYAKRLFALHSNLLLMLQQSLYALKYLKAMGFEKQETLRIKRILEEHRQVGFRVAAIHQALGPIMQFSYILLICGGIWIGIILFREEIQLSLLVPLVYALFRLLKPVRQLASSLIKLEENLQAARRLFGTLMTEDVFEEEKQGISLLESINSVKLIDVRYGYNNDWEVLEGINMELQRGQMTALMGESGAGKSTLCDLVMGLYPEYQGKILINGHDLRTLKPNIYRRVLGYVPQEPLLIRGTIRGNLLYGSNDGVKKEELIAALQRAHAWEFVGKLQEGLDTELGERGVTLSGGECQRLCLARALLRKPQLLILDEATSSLDQENEAKILKALQELRKDMIILLISHRFSILKFVDQILLMEEGKMRQLDFKTLE